MPVAPLPLPISELPEAIRRFADPAAPGPARTMAARGVVPGIRGENLVALLVQLTADPDAQIAETAKKSIAGLPETVLDPACEAPLAPSFLDRLADLSKGNDERLARIVANQATADETVQRVARSCSELVSERIATNEQRLLRFPLIIEALYMNAATRMSTADRLIDLAVRNGVELTGIPSFKAHAEALQGQLIPEASDEALPSDQLFKAALEADSDEPEAFEEDEEKGEEQLKDKFIPLHARIKSMTVPEKVRLALVGDAAARAMLIRDPKKVVALAAVGSPRITEPEALAIAKSKEVAQEVLRFVSRKRDWMGVYDIKRALVFNPKAPPAVTMAYVPHLLDSDLKILSKSRGIPAALKTAALQRLNAKAKP